MTSAIDTSAIDIERRLRERYRQPAGVEQYGIEPVPEERQTVGWFDLFSIMFNFLINPGTMMVGGMMVASGLSFQAAVAAGFVGTVVALVFYLIMATLGADYGLPGLVATRVVYGLRGAKLIPSLLRALVSVYWFAFQTFVGASAIVAVLAKITGTTYPLVWVSLAFALVRVAESVGARLALRRRLDDQRAQPLFGRVVAFQYVRADRAVLDRADREAVRDCAIRGARRDQLLQIYHRVRKRLCTGRRRA